MENKKIVVVIVILTLALLASLGYIGYTTYLKMTDQTVKTVIDDVALDLNNFYRIGETLNNLDEAFNNANNSYFGAIYGDGNLMVEKMDKTTALYASIYQEIEATGQAQNISGDQVKKNMENMFGKNVQYKPEALKLSETQEILYNSEEGIFAHIIPVQSRYLQPKIYLIDVSTTVCEGKIEVKRKMFYVEFQMNETNTRFAKATLYTNKDKKRTIATINLKNGVLNEKEIAAKYSSRLNTYIYTFNEYKDGEYALYSIERQR